MVRGRAARPPTEEGPAHLSCWNSSGGRPSDKVVGQAARYIGYVRTHLTQPGQQVEGLIIAHEADDAQAERSI